MRALLLLLMLGAGAVRADCSRPLNVPAAPQSMSILPLKDGSVSGVVPEFYRALGKKAGCTFQFTIVPRARLEAMFSTGEADLLVTATKSPQRDKSGQFVPLFKYRATLVSLRPMGTPIRTMEDLAARDKLRVCVVRGFDYGEPYRKLLAALEKEKRLCQAPDPRQVLRMIHANLADVTILLPSSAFATAREDNVLASSADKLHFDALDQLPWQDAGVYVSTKSLTPSDQATLLKVLRADGTSDAIMQAYESIFPDKLLKISARRL
ncbi:MAG: transporter substrate-binding domain-containing protein [Pseudomonadota bacterium]